MMNLQGINDLISTGENTVVKEALNIFINTLAKELLTEELLQAIEPISEDIFTTETVWRDLQIDLSTNISLVIEYEATCEYEVNTVDETDNGGGRVGEVCGIDTIAVTIDSIIFYTHDGGEFDLTDNKNIREAIIKNLVI